MKRFTRGNFKLQTTIVLFVVFSLLVSIASYVFAATPTITLNPASPNGENGWYVTAPTVSISTTSTDTLEYKWDTDSTYTAVNATTTAFAAIEGNHTLTVLSLSSGSVDGTNTVTTKVDTTKPTVLSTDPTDTATGVARDKNITITFGEDIAAGTDYSKISVRFGRNNHVRVPIRKSISGKTLTIDPIRTLGRATTYTVTIPADSIKDMAGNSIAASKSFSFTTIAAGRHQGKHGGSKKHHGGSKKRGGSKHNGAKRHGKKRH